MGINTAIIPGGQGIGFSIPINLAKEVSSKLKSNGRVVRGFIGVGIQTLTPALKQALRLPVNTDGALVTSVLPDGPAAAAGLNESDVIVAVNNNRIQSDRDLLNEVAQLPIGQEIPFTVQRDEAEETVFITIVERPSQESVSRPPSPTQPDDRSRVGIVVQDSRSGNEAHVIITEIIAGSPAARAGLRQGDHIRAVGPKAVSTAQEFVTEVSRVQGDLALLVRRQGRTTYIVVKE